MGTTDMVALYAAIVATVVLAWDVYKWLQSGAHLYFYTFRETVQNLPNLQKDLLHIRIIATNIGDRPTTILKSNFLYYKGWLSRVKSSLPLTQRKPDNIIFYEHSDLPYVLKPGDVWQGLCVPDEKVMEMAKHGLLFYALYASHRKRPKTRRLYLKK